MIPGPSTDGLLAPIVGTRGKRIKEVKLVIFYAGLLAHSNLASKVRAHACCIEQAWLWRRRKNEQSHTNLALKV